MAKRLPTTFTKILKVLCSSSIQQALECYWDFIKQAHTKKGKATREVLPNLRDVREKTLVLNVLPSPEVIACVDISSNTNSSFPEECIKTSDHDNSSNIIDWNFTTIADEMLAKHSQLLNDNMDNSITGQFHSLDTEDGGIEWGIEDTGAYELVQSEICWDISIENASITVHEEPFNFNESSMKYLSKCPASNENEHSKSPFLETVYINKPLDDLFELKVFLNQRLVEIDNEEASSLQPHVQVVAPPALQRYGPDSFRNMSFDLSQAIYLLIKCLMEFPGEDICQG